MKLIGNHVFFPALHLHHPDTGKRLILIGEVHFGPAGMYEEMIKYVKAWKSQDYVVTREGVDYDCLPLDIKSQYANILRNAYYKLVRQGGHFSDSEFKKHVRDICFLESHSLSYLSFLRNNLLSAYRYTARYKRLMQRAHRRLNFLDSKERKRALGVILINSTSRYSRALNRRRLMEFELPGILHAREQHAAEKMRMMLSDPSVPGLVSVWGATHISGFVRIFRGYGYMLGKTEWLRAVSLSDLGLH